MHPLNGSCCRTRYASHVLTRITCRSAWHCTAGWSPVTPNRPLAMRRDALAERNADIVRRRRNGETLDSIAVRYGITRQRVHQIASGTPDWNWDVYSRQYDWLVAQESERLDRWRRQLR